MASMQKQVAAAVVSELTTWQSTLGFTPAFTATRTYAPSFDPATLTGILIYVGSTGERIDLFGEMRTRSECEHDYPIQLAIYAKAQASDVTALDALSDFRERVIDLFTGKESLTALPNASLVEATNPQSHDPGKLQSNGLYEAVITLTYRVLR